MHMYSIQYIQKEKNDALQSSRIQIYDTLLKIFTMAKQENIPTYEASNRLAEERIIQVAKHKTQ